MSDPPPPGEVVPAGYGELLEQVKTEVRSARVRATRAATTELIDVYWQVGRLILDRQQAEGWGTKVIERLAGDLRAAFPGMRGLSQRNLVYMRSFAAAFPGETITQRCVAQLPWGHITVLLDRVEGATDRAWYAAAAVEHGWTRDVLTHQITSRLHTRVGAAPSNCTATLPSTDSDLAQAVVRDPYLLDFLDLSPSRSPNATSRPR